MKNKGYAKIWGGAGGQIRCIVGNVELGLWCFDQILCYAVLAEPFYPIFYERIQEICSLFEQLPSIYCF